MTGMVDSSMMPMLGMFDPLMTRTLKLKTDLK